MRNLFARPRYSLAGPERVQAQEDHHLMRSVRNGDVGKLATLYARHQRPLFNFFLRLTSSRPVSEDLVHDVFTRILKYRTSYGEQEHFTPWMYRIARNAHIEHARQAAAGGGGGRSGNAAGAGFAGPGSGAARRIRAECRDPAAGVGTASRGQA